MDQRVRPLVAPLRTLHHLPEMPIRYEQRTNAVRIPVRAQPRASRSEIVGEHDGALKIRLAAPPVDGEANRELIRFLARVLRVPQSAIEVAGGASGKNKLVDITGVTLESVQRTLGV
jgi:uncharacterized protein (TIGR00251 family)